jgi:hypothetical protein
MRSVFLAVFVFAALWGTGCATTQDEPNRVSTIPWNRPQPWEGAAGVPGFTPQGY